MPEISVIVPVYRAEEYLMDCVQSILRQTFSDMEILLVDDGSPDGCGAMCDALAAEDSRISVIHQSNQGQAAARNHALEKASGQWVCFVDSDDVIHPQMVQRLYQAARESGAAMSMCQMLQDQQLSEDFFRDSSGSYQLYSMDEQTLLELHDADAYPAWVACAKLIRREVVQTHLFQPGRVYEDNEAVCHWVVAAGQLACLPEALYFYRTNPDSTTNRRFSLKRLDYLWALEQIIRFYGGVGYDRLRSRFLERYVEAVGSTAWGLRQEQPYRHLVGRVCRQCGRFLRTQQAVLTRQQKEFLLEAAHPKLIRLYWPMAGAWRTVKEAGLQGLWRKIFRKREEEDSK